MTPADSPTLAGTGARLRSGILREAAGLAWIAAQFVAILLLARAFRLESPAFYNVVLPLAAGGFLVHHWLPRAYQPGFFAALSLVGVFLIFELTDGAWLIGIGTGLIALCHVPLPFRWRVVLIGLAGAVLVALRARWMPAPWPGVIWPVLGSMFMFRLAMYLYDLKHRGPAPAGFVLSYFFLLPNSVFLLFPVIDFQTFRRTHYDKPAFEIYGEGIRWMFRGLTHLVIYRFIYHYVALSPADVTSTATLVQYLVGNYGLYLRVSGQFHTIVGLLHLFGFRLPETHRFFYLASSFSDFWRRINIYWKDFMQKMVYLPVVFRLKRRGETTAIVVAPMCVTIATWLLHSYQWFWLLGEWLLSATDMAFWGVLGLLLVANSLREQRKGRERQLTAHVPPSTHAWRHALQTAGMFAVMVILWGLWTSPTFEDFGVILRAATLRAADIAVVVGTLGVVALAAFISRRFSLGTPGALTARPRWQHPLVVGAFPLALVWIAGEPILEGRVPAPVQATLQQARVAELNKSDADRMQRGYYERIVGVNRFNGELWEVYTRAQAGHDAERDDAIAFMERMVIEDDLGNRTLRPLARDAYRGSRFTTNRWGLRDKDYELTPPPGTRRMAVLGPSYVMGSGINDGEPFEQLVEDRLNREWTPSTGLRYELINFAVFNYTLDQQAVILQNGRVASFHPDVVLVVGNQVDGANTAARNVVRRFQNGFENPNPLAMLLNQAGVTKEMPEARALALLQPRFIDFARLAFESIVFEARRMGATPIYALIPMPRANDRGGATLLSVAAEAGLIVRDLRDVYSGHNEHSLTVSDTDFHPNAQGHRVIAERLYKELSNLPPGVFLARNR